MSCYFEQEYACISFDRIVPEEELRSMLAELSINLLDRQLSKADLFYQLEEITYDLENGEITREKALEQITDVSQKFLQKIEHIQDCTSITVLAEYDSEFYDTEVGKEIAKHLFAKSNESHFIWRRAAFDTSGAYSHQWIGFWEDHKIELIDADDYFAKQFSVSVSA